MTSNIHDLIPDDLKHLILNINQFRPREKSPLNASSMEQIRHPLAEQKDRASLQRDPVLSVKDVARLLGYDYKYTLFLFSKGVIPGRQRAKGCKITVRQSTIERLFPERPVRMDE